MYYLSYDIGTTSLKTCLYRVDGTITLESRASKAYPVRITPDGGAEQDPEDWWQAMAETTWRVMAESGVSPGSLGGLSFCSQMQAFVPVDRNGRALRPAMIYMDQRSGRELTEGLRHGFKVAGMNAGKLLSSLVVTGGVSASVKDPVWKYKWVEGNEPEVFRRLYKWLDVKEYVSARCTGSFAMTEDSANTTFLYDTRPGKHRWSAPLLKRFGVNPHHMPEVIRAADDAGCLRKKAAEDLGLPEGLKVFGGGGDLTMISLGSGGVTPGDTHVYMGTSGWVSQVTDRRRVDIGSFMASIIGAPGGLYNYIGETETAGKCLEWVRDHLALDEIGVYRQNRGEQANLLEYLDEVTAGTAPGAGGVFFTPWLHGSRSPFEDPAARGVFFGISINTGKRDLIRAVVEGMVYQAAWQLSIMERKLVTADKVRFVGGGALSRSTARILADVTGKTVEVPAEPQNAGALGAAMVCAVGSGALSSYDEAAQLIPLGEVYEPDTEMTEFYTGRLEFFKHIHRHTRKLFAARAALEGS